MRHYAASLLVTSFLLLAAGGVPSTVMGQDAPAKPSVSKQEGATVQGIWLGILEVSGIKLRLALKVSKDSTGALSAKLDSIDQGASNLQMDSINQQGSSVHFETKEMGLSYDGTLNDSGTEIAGTFKQGPALLPLVFKRTDAAPTLGRPQDPQKPYPYDEEEVGYENKTDRVHLAGTLTLPRSKGPHPAVLLITGSGSQDRNETIAGHRPFLVLADYLTRHGIAVLRVDDRGIGGSSMGAITATSENFAGDVLAGVEYLKTRKEIDPKQIGLAGHSEGGLIAPMVAVRSPDVAFIVLIAGLGQTGEDVIHTQDELLERAEGASEYTISQTRIALKRTFAILKAEPDNVVAERRIRETFTRQLSEMSAEQRKGFAPVETMINSQITTVYLSPWFRFFLAFDPRPTLMRVKIPVLAVNGERDLQVSAKENLPLISAALKAGGNKDFTTVVLPKLNHLLQTSETGAPTEYGETQETMAPLALVTITSWILRHTTPR